MFNVSSNLDDFAKNLKGEVQTRLESQMVEELVNRARADGEVTVDYINLSVEGESDGIRIDQARVKRLANERLRSPGAVPLVTQAESLVQSPRGLVASADD